MELYEVLVEEHQLQKHGGVDGGDQEAVDPEDGRQRLPEGPGGEHAHEVG